MGASIAPEAVAAGDGLSSSAGAGVMPPSRHHSRALAPPHVQPAVPPGIDAEDGPELTPDADPVPAPAPPSRSVQRNRSCKWRRLEPKSVLSGTKVELRLPRYALPVVTRSLSIDFSLISQTDGLAAKCRGRGARIERDTLAVDDASSLCSVRGCAPWVSPGSFCGLYLCDFVCMPEVVAFAASHRACGFFVVPKVKNAYPAFVVRRLSSTGATTWRSYAWYDYLMSYALMVFDLPHDAFTDLSGVPLRFLHGTRIVLAQFGRNGALKAVPRIEQSFRLRSIPELMADGPKLGVRPVLLHRASPYADEDGPTLADDSCPATPAPSRSLMVPAPAPLASRWAAALPAFRTLAATYPFTVVSGLAMDVLTTGVRPYKGSLDKAVVYHDRGKLDDASEMAKRVTMMKEATLDVPRIIGPLSECPFDTPRVCPCRTLEKDPYDPASTRLRLISNFSKRARGRHSGSVNDLSYSPKLLSFHVQPSHIRDTLAWLFLSFGPGIRAWTADIPSCFRLNHLHPSLLSLFVYFVSTAEHGPEWFVDLATPFGWSPAEWGWQCVLALILWAFRCRGLAGMFAFVDNFFYLFHPAAGGAEANPVALYARISEVFDDLDIPLHEEMIGTSFKGMGWMWDLSPSDGPPLMVCAQDKYDHLCRQLRVWSAAAELPFEQVESIIGFLVWIAAGFPVGRPHVGYLRGNLINHRTAYKPSRDEKECDQLVLLGRESREALSFWHRFFPLWDKKCAVFLDFGPMAGPEVVWRYDASTDWGCGALMWKIGAPVAYYVAHKWTQTERTLAFVRERESTGVMESMAAARCSRSFSRRSARKRVLMEGDNQTLTSALARCYSPTRLMMANIHAVCHQTARHGICLRSSHVKGMCTSLCCASS